MKFLIKIVKGNLIHAREDIIGHQVNAQGAMNSGVARSVREAFPNVYKEYRELVTGLNNAGDFRHTLMGQVQGVSIGNGKWVANLFGQNDFGYDKKTQYTDTASLFQCFLSLRKTAENANMSVALPYKIGCYRGGANWEEVEVLLLTAFEGYEVTLYKYHEGV